MLKRLKSGGQFLFWISIVFFLVAYDAFGGLIMEQVRYQQGSSEKQRGTIYISDNKIKFADEDKKAEAIFDLNTGVMIQIDNVNKRYVIAKPDEYFEFMKNLTSKMNDEIQKQLSQLPPEKRAEMEKMMKSQGLIPSGNVSKPKKLTLRDTGSSESIAGYKSLKYELYEDGKLGEEIWISKDLKFSKEIDMKKLSKYIGKIKELTYNAKGGDGSIDGEEKVFREIYESGFPMKTIDHSSPDRVYVEEVEKVRISDIPDSEFQPHPDYKKITLNEMIGLSK